MPRVPPGLGHVSLQEDPGRLQYVAELLELRVVDEREPRLTALNLN